MKILKGVVSGVVDKGTPEKAWAMVGIESRALNRNGFIETTLYELGVFGQAHKNGLHNAFRDINGVEVYVPFEVKFDEKYKQYKYELAGIPLRIAEQRPVQSTTAPKAVGA
jgi:hypothetical protein